MSWEKEETRWFGKPHSNQNSLRVEGGVGFLVVNALQMRLSLLIV